VNFAFNNSYTQSGGAFDAGCGDVSFNNSYTQTGGTFYGGLGPLTFNFTFNLSGGTFNAPSGTLSVVARFTNFTVGGTATFNPNNGTVVFNGDGYTFLDVPATFTLASLTIDKSYPVYFASTSTVVTTGTLALTQGAINNNGGAGTLEARGGVSIASSFSGGSANLLIDGPATRTITLPAGAAGIPPLTINAPN